MGFRALRVINDDRVAPSTGFGAHAHRDMEIITYILDGHLTHRDSTGEHHTFGQHTIQTMSAGSGIVHSEFNESPKEPVHLLQIWIEPSVEDVKPAYQQIEYEPAEAHGKLRLLASPEPTEKTGAAQIYQDARVYASVIGSGESIEQPVAPNRYAWVHVARGNLNLNGQELKTGDGAAISEESKLALKGTGPNGAEILFFDLP